MSQKPKVCLVGKSSNASIPQERWDEIFSIKLVAERLDCSTQIIDGVTGEVTWDSRHRKTKEEK